MVAFSVINVYLAVDKESQLIGFYDNPNDAIAKVKELETAIPFAKTESTSFNPNGY